MEGNVIKFEHTDGRVCFWSSMTQAWFHWDHKEGEPNPRSRVEYRCKRPTHPTLDETQVGRGEFGMPTVGGQVGSMFDRFIPAPGSKVDRVSDIMDEAQRLYKRKAAGYKGVEGDLADHLGVKGQFVDINRKFWRIKAMLWDEVVPMYPDEGAGESVEEILMDFIGHAALTIDFLRQSQGDKEEGQS